jgi:hypothetical protein
MSISGRLRMTFAALMEDSYVMSIPAKINDRDRSPFPVQQNSQDLVPGTKSSEGHHSPRFPRLPMAFLRIPIDDPARQVAHLM